MFKAKFSGNLEQVLLFWATSGQNFGLSQISSQKKGNEQFDRKCQVHLNHARISADAFKNGLKKYFLA